MALPQYSDEEVRHFHPAVEEALNLAIEHLGLENDYEVLHHPTIGSIPPDFAVVSKQNNKFHLIVEVKRRPNDVVSTRYRHQAKSYVEEAGALAEKKYYAITNLEYTDLFLHSHEASRSSVLLQLLNGSPYISGNLDEANMNAANEATFKARLVENFMEILRLVQRDYAEYTNMSSKLYELFSTTCNSHEEWHKAFMVCGYEWMRGVMSSIRRLPTGIRDAATYQRNPERLAQAGRRVDFHALFSEPYPDSRNAGLWDARLLREMHSHGSKRLSGDELAVFAHEVVYGGRHHDGIVMTDPELSSLLAAIARRVHGNNLAAHEKVCDPAAGAGTLLANIQNFFSTIQPKQIWANEKELFLQEPLAIRVGLAYASSISPDNAPVVTINNILNFDRSHFEQVKVVVMNPPYLRRVDSGELCARFAEKISEITGEPSSTNVGQSGLESLFTELVFELVQPGTTICCILPQQYLQLRGDGARAFRRFLLNKFKVRLIAHYPMKGLFETVTKATSIYATKKGEENNDIELIELSHALSDLNVNQTIASGSNDAYGLHIRTLSKRDLSVQVNDGWSHHIGSKALALLAIEEMMNQATISLRKLAEHSRLRLRRGRLGNSGGTKLVFPNLNASIWQSLEPLIPDGWLSKGINYSDSVPIARLTNENLSLFALTPPTDAFVNDTEHNLQLRSIIETYKITLNNNAPSAQRQENKTINQLLELVKSEKRKISDTPVLIPRNLRRHGRIFYSQVNLYVSTNFVEAYGDEEDKKLLASWLLTSFAQLNFELLSTPREGTRKLEVADIKEVMVPDFSTMTPADKQSILEVFDSLGTEGQFIDLYCPHLQGSPLDDMWYRCLWGEDASLKKEDILGHLSDVTYERDPNSNCA